MCKNLNNPIASKKELERLTNIYSKAKTEIKRLTNIYSKAKTEIKRLESLCALYAEALKLACEKLDKRRKCPTIINNKCRSSYVQEICDSCRRNAFLLEAQNETNVSISERC